MVFLLGSKRHSHYSFVRVVRRHFSKTSVSRLGHPCEAYPHVLCGWFSHPTKASYSYADISEAAGKTHLLLKVPRGGLLMSTYPAPASPRGASAMRTPRRTTAAPADELDADDNGGCFVGAVDGFLFSFQEGRLRRRQRTNEGTASPRVGRRPRHRHNNRDDNDDNDDVVVVKKINCLRWN
jgi:hypothetical protein